MKPDAPRAVRLQALRQSKRLSRAQLALMAGVSPETVRNAEQGRCEPSARVAGQLAQALGVTVGDLQPETPATLKGLRAATGLTQRAMSKVIGMSAAMVSKVEQGTYGVRDPARWAVGYQVTPEEWTRAWQAGREARRRAIDQQGE